MDNGNLTYNLRLNTPPHFIKYKVKYIFNS